MKRVLASWSLCLAALAAGLAVAVLSARNRARASELDAVERWCETRARANELRALQNTMEEWRLLTVPPRDRARELQP